MLIFLFFVLLLLFVLFFFVLVFVQKLCTVSFSSWARWQGNCSRSFVWTGSGKVKAGSKRKTKKACVPCSTATSRLARRNPVVTTMNSANQGSEVCAVWDVSPVRCHFFPSHTHPRRACVLQAARFASVQLKKNQSNINISRKTILSRNISPSISNTESRATGVSFR